MHSALQLAPVLAAEKSKVPFYIAGALLIVWALVISMAVGMRREQFPRDKAQQRLVMGVSGVLVALTLAMAVATSGAPEKTAEASAAAVSTQPSGETSTAPTSTQPTATTGTPAPSSSPAAGTGTKLAIAADPSGQLAYSTKTLQAPAGTVTITMTNMSPLEHNFTLIEKNQKVLGATPTFVGGTRSLTLKLKPGRYTFYCSVPGHRQAGMEGTLTVSS